MQTVIHKADTRGTAFFGWLHSRHTFSFGRYYDPERMQFGALRVLNDDIVEAAAGFGTHPHDNMEIVSIPLEGALEHKDSTGRTKAIKTGDVQIMSAGSGITHSEYNHSKTEKVNFLQIWVLPKELNITPRYQQITFDPEDRKNKLQTVVAPDDESAVWINQDAWFTRTDLDKGKTITYDLHREGNGLYTFVLAGEAIINGHPLSQRDAIGISDASKVELEATTRSSLLLIEVPMNV